jgi:glycosyltransferase involved in cell wall biosynthesis
MRLAIVIPCYNEADGLRETVARLLSVLERLQRANKAAASLVYLVDDGSTDSTWLQIEQLVRQHPQVCGIKLSRNRGHQNALLAGVLTAEGDAVISIDADLQDDVDVIEQMTDEYARGTDIVYGVRRRRDADSTFKRVSAQVFYWLLRALAIECVPDHADYRLLSRRAVEALREFREVNLFMRGIVPLLGNNAAIVYYDRSERFAGASKYRLSKMMMLALDGITSFSVFPLRLITLLGFAVFFASLIVSGWVIWTKFFTAQAVPGWASTVLPIVFPGRHPDSVFRYHRRVSRQGVPGSEGTAALSDRARLATADGGGRRARFQRACAIGAPPRPVTRTLCAPRN